MQGFKFTDGFVRIKIWGGSTERFLVMCAHKKMSIWDIETNGKYVFANMLLHDFYQCRQLAKKAGIRAVVVERHGLPFFVPKIINRCFLPIGFVLFLIIWFISTNMLLHISIEGNYSISDDMFLDYLETQGIYIGMWKKDIPLEELEKNIRKQFDLVTWTSGRIDGTILTISIKENEKVIAEKPDKLPYGSNIYASADGIVDSILVRNGIPMVKKGDEVKKGDLLVSGEVPVLNEASEVVYIQYYESDADIEIVHWTEVEYHLPRVYVEKRHTGRETEGMYLFVGSKIYRNTLKDKKYSYKDYILLPKWKVNIGDTSAGAGLYHVKEYVNIEKEYGKKEAEELLYQEFEKNNIILMQKGVQILEKNVTIDVIVDKWVLKGTLKVIMPAVIHQPIEKPEELHDSEGI